MIKPLLCFLLLTLGASAATQMPVISNVNSRWFYDDKVRLPSSLRKDLPVRLGGRLMNENPAIQDVLYGQIVSENIRWNTQNFQNFVEGKLLNAARPNILHRYPFKGDHHHGFFIELQTYDYRKFPMHSAYFVVYDREKSVLFWYSDYGPFFKRDLEEVFGLVKGIKLN